VRQLKAEAGRRLSCPCCPFLPTNPAPARARVNTQPRITVIAGTIGGGSKLEFTLIGDTVNVAARVEQLTKTTGDAILLTQQSVDALVTRPPGLTDRGSHALKGKSAAVQVFGLDPSTAPGTSRPPSRS
jgi:class 3 adenylate cyclase